MDRIQPHLHHDIDTSQAEEKRLRGVIRGQARAIVDYLRAHGPRTRAELAEGTGIRIQSICPAVVALRDDGYIVELETKRGRGHLLQVTP